MIVIDGESEIEIKLMWSVQKVHEFFCVNKNSFKKKYDNLPMIIAD